MPTPRADSRSPSKKPAWNAVGHYYPHNDLIEHIRTLVRASRNRESAMGSSIAPDGMPSKKADEVSYWKEVFDKYDTDGSGALDLSEVTDMVRFVLKLSERVISDIELRDFFHHIDLNGDQMIDWNEWLQFVSQGRLKDTRPLSQVIDAVGRAVRGALRRNGMLPNQVEDRLKALPEVSERAPGRPIEEIPIDYELFKLFLRKGLDISRHDCPDDFINRTFASVCGNSLHTSFREVNDFFSVACLAKTHKEIGFGTTFPGLIGGMHGKLPSRSPTSRPGTFPFGGTVSGATTMPFCLNGRNLPPATRIATTLTPVNRLRKRLRPVISCPELRTQDTGLADLTLAAFEGARSVSNESAELYEDPEEVRIHSAAATSVTRGKKGMVSLPEIEGAQSKSLPVSPLVSSTGFRQSGGSFISNGSTPFELALAAAKSVQDDVLSDPFAMFKASVVSSTEKDMKAEAEAKRKELANQGSYRVIVGKDALNRIEARLHEAGVDVRGGYYRAGHPKH